MRKFRPYTIPRTLIPIPESETDMSISQNNQSGVMNSTNSSPSTERNILDSLRIPDAVKDLPKFDGNPRLLYDFISNVEEILTVLTPIDGTPLGKMILRSIRNKIEGEANEILNMYSTDLSWQSIKNNLILHYSDKRNETSLIRDLHLLKQNNKTLEEFYSSVVEIQASINNNLMIHEVDANIIKAKRDLFDKMCLNTFLSGLREPLGSSIRAMKPDTLPIAFSYCITEQNMFYIRQENRNILKRQETHRQYNSQHSYPNIKKPFTPNHYRQQNAIYSPPMHFNRPQLPMNQPFNRPQLNLPTPINRPQLAQNFLPTPMQTQYPTATNNQNQFSNFRQQRLDSNTNLPPPEPMDTSSGYTHLRNNSGQTRRFPREVHHIDHNYRNFNTYSDPVNYNIPNYLPELDNYNEIEDVQNFQLDASKTQQDT